MIQIPKMLDEYYYNPQKLLSYNCLFNFINGERGNGKSYAFKRYCINRYIKFKEEFIWLRRYLTELDDMEEFFKDLIKNNAFPNHEFKVKGGKIYCDNQVMGYYMPLSTTLTKKSVPYPNVKTIVFDEYLINKSNYHYLPNEVHAFFDFYETVARMRDVRVFFIANSISENNPYHIFFNMKAKGEFTMIKKDVILQITNNVEYRFIKQQTRFAKIIDGTSYSRYAIENEMLEDNKSFIEKKSSGAILRGNIAYGDKIVGIWIDTKEGKIYCSDKYNTDMPVYCITTDDMKPNYLILKTTSHFMKTIKTGFEYGIIYYENIRVKGIMEKVKKYLYIR